jgi:VWFA-related protein
MLLAAALVVAATIPVCVPVGADRSTLSVKITSPLGRLGIPGTVRIVAQIEMEAGAVLSPVQFYVDGKLLKSVEGGPPYAAEWVDENPFEPRELAVAVADSLGNTARDKVLLKPLEVVENTDVPRVLVDASVQDKTGRFVSSLSPAQFRVYEDGEVQKIDLAGLDELPATFALLIDSSQSMSRRLDFVKQAATRLAGYLRPKDHMLVVPFSRTLGTITGPTDDRRTVVESIGRVTSSGGTAILDAIVSLTPHLAGIHGRRAIVLITDGYDEHSGQKFADALSAIKSVQATVYVVGIGGVAGISLRGERLLRQLAEETGGRAFLPSREEELEFVHDVLASDVQNRYLLSYTPSNQKTDGAWRKISVETADPTHKVRARDGYFAPKPPPVRPSIEFTVTDAENRIVDVNAADLIVTEDGVEQTIEAFSESISPVSIMLALDRSGSMKKWADTAKAAAAKFVDALRPQDTLGVLMFADRSEIVVDLGTGRDKAHAAIAAYTPGGGTALYDALGDSLDRLKKVEGRRAIVVVTDGRDEDNPGTGPGSVRNFQQIVDAAESVDAMIFGIGVGQKVDQPVLTTLASSSGGAAYFPEDVSQLEEEYRRIVESLRRRWIISYTSTNGTRNGGWRPVTIRTKDGKAMIHSRGGYFAPER